MIQKYHGDWQNNRVDFVVKKFGADFFKEKTVLELGSYNGFIGEAFRLLGAKVLSVEGRQENVETIKQDYPLLDVIQKDLDSNEWDLGHWDIIVNFGLFYHLSRCHEQHLINCTENSNLMFFETVVFNSFESEIFKRKEEGPDQSLSQEGGYPSIKYVEDIFHKKEVEFERFENSSLNGDAQFYNIPVNNSKILIPNSRKFWIAKNKTNI